MTDSTIGKKTVTLPKEEYDALERREIVVIRKTYQQYGTNKWEKKISYESEDAVLGELAERTNNAILDAQSAIERMAFAEDELARMKKELQEMKEWHMDFRAWAKRARVKDLKSFQKTGIIP